MQFFAKAYLFNTNYRNRFCDFGFTFILINSYLPYSLSLGNFDYFFIIITFPFIIYK